MNNRAIKTEYKVACGLPPMRIAVAADLHNSPWNDTVEIIADSDPDIIVSPGDLFGALTEDRSLGEELSGRYVEEAKNNEIGFEFLREVTKIAPVYCSVGNHEVRVSAENREKISATGAHLLDNEYIILDNGIALGGLSTGGAHGLFHKSDQPDIEWLRSFASLNAPKILLSHHPEYWPRYIRGLGIELTLSGHAHGGQWRFFGRGVFAPGQGFLPKYTSGVHKKNGEYLVVSRGLRKSTELPRINNPLEVLIIDIV